MYLLLDTETTGVDDNSSIIQIAWQVLDEKLEPTTPVRSYFVNTVTEVPPEASAVNHIIYEDLEEAPSMHEVLQKIEDSCRLRGVKALVCHNLAFDGKMLQRYALPELLSSTEGICTLKISRHLWPDEKSHSLQYLRYSIPLKVSRDVIPHRADTDVKVLSSLLQHINLSFDELVDISSKPVEIKKMPFGKHKGDLLTTIPKSYVEWALRLPDLDEDLRYSLRKAISV